MKALAVFFALGLAALCFADSEVQLRVETDLEASYRQGDVGIVAIDVSVLDPEAVLQEGVLFLNVVENNAERNFPQAAHKIFARAEESPQMFRRALTGEELRQGVSTSLRFQLRNRAKLADYALVIQLFSGSEVDPKRVDVDNRMGMRAFVFGVEEW